MKPLIALLLMLCTLTACGSGSMTDVKYEPPPEAAAPPAVVHIISYDVEMAKEETVIRDEDGTLLATYGYELPVLYPVREDGSRVEEPQTPEEVEALNVAETFNQNFATWTDSAHVDTLAGYAREERKLREEMEMPWEEHFSYTEDLTCKVYQTGQMVSVSALYYTYTGGAHPNYVLYGWNFDLTTGDYFPAEALAADGQEFSDLVTAEIVRQAQLRAAEEGLEAEQFFWEDYREVAANWGSNAVTFHENGMTVGYSPYEMAAYAAGAQEFTLDYALLRPALSQHGLEVLGLAP